MASRILQEAQRASPGQILRQTQQAAQDLFARTQGVFTASPRTTVCVSLMTHLLLRKADFRSAVLIELLTMAGSVQKASAGLNGAADSFSAGHRPGASSAAATPRPTAAPRPSPTPPATLEPPATHAVGIELQSTPNSIAAKTDVGSLASHGAISHAEPPPAGPSPARPADAVRVAGVISHAPVTASDGTASDFASSIGPSKPSTQAPAAAAGPTVHEEGSRALDGLLQADGASYPSLPHPPRASEAQPSQPQHELASAMQSSAAAVQQAASSSGAASQKEQLPPNTLTSPLAAASATARPLDSAEPRAAPVKRKPRERRVPSSPFGRVMGFAGLGASLVAGTVRDSVAGYFQPRPAEGESPASAVSAN